MATDVKQLSATWRERASAGRDTLLLCPVESYQAQFATVLATERCADELDAALSAILLVEEGRQVQETEKDTRVDTPHLRYPADNPTAASNEAIRAPEPDEHAREAAWRRTFTHVPHTCVAESSGRFCRDCGGLM